MGYILRSQTLEDIDQLAEYQLCFPFHQGVSPIHHFFQGSTPPLHQQVHCRTILVYLQQIDEVLPPGHFALILDLAEDLVLPLLGYLLLLFDDFESAGMHGILIDHMKDHPVLPLADDLLDAEDLDNQLLVLVAHLPSHNLPCFYLSQHLEFKYFLNLINTVRTLIITCGQVKE